MTARDREALDLALMAWRAILDERFGLSVHEYTCLQARHSCLVMYP